MGLRSGLWKLLARGDESEPDPDEWVELVTVQYHQGPLMVADLAAHGIDATFHDAFGPDARSLTRSQVRVRRSDLSAAHDVITT